MGYKRIFYSGVGSVGDSSLVPLPFGASGGPGFSWTDVDIVSLGAEWRATNALTLRAGYAKNTNPVSSANVALNILAPGVVTDHLTAGLSYKVTPDSNFDVALVYTPDHHVSGTVPAAFGGGNVDLHLSEFEVTLGYTYKFDSAPPVAVAKY